MNVLLSAPVGAPIPFPTGWLPGAGLDTPLAAVSLFSWEHFTDAERLAFALRDKDHAVHVVSYPEGDGCALICKEEDADAVAAELNALLPRPPHAPDRAPARQMGPKKQGWEAVFALFHVRGLQYQRATGKKWTQERADRIEAFLGYPESSSNLTEDELSTLIDHLREDLEAVGFNVEGDNASYRARRREADARQAQTRQAAPRVGSAPASPSSRSAGVAGHE